MTFEWYWGAMVLSVFVFLFFFVYNQPQEEINQSHHMGNEWILPSISSSTGKCKKTHRLGRTR